MFAGVAKQPAELEAGLAANILQFNVESWAELEALNAAAGRLGKVAPVALRVNPDVDAQTLAKITTGSRGNKFGLPFDDIPALVQQMQTLPHVRLEALAMHIGSQLFKMQPFSDAYKRLADLTRHLASEGTVLKRLDMEGCYLARGKTPINGPIEDLSPITEDEKELFMSGCGMLGWLAGAAWPGLKYAHS